jgi:hypothetical protein
MASFLLLALAHAQPVDYERGGGTGILTITPGSNGLRKFGLPTFGAATFHNLKLCSK